MFKKCADDLKQLLKPEIYAAVVGEDSVFSADLNSDGSCLNRLMALNILTFPVKSGNIDIARVSVHSFIINKRRLMII
ncbi:hypothetical protein [Brunnivagina elsteri]|uniref:Uncharacterized protein n=1 Tax=Brunnivagina elsteri CCALA 953 TaxID=987040 RepID=A0A2A2T9Y4_9CYAN|nr:hypothetical protein [Calothrix elsteri]PAX45696.1 hypothetical protein CK510_30425 [Calothrix elsteri CCALA 953]